jgi:hypothetical protein
MSTEEWLPYLMAALAGTAIAAACGLRAFLPLLAFAGGARLGWVKLDPSLGWLTSDIAVIMLGVAAGVELLADKIPVLDHALDAVATVVRPAAAAVAAWAGFAAVHPALALCASLVLGGSALGVHLAKSKVRVGSSALTLGAANPVISFLEDAVTVLLIVMALLAPVLAFMAVLAAGGWLAARVAAGSPRQPNGASHVE